MPRDGHVIGAIVINDNGEIIQVELTAILTCAMMWLITLKRTDGRTAPVRRTGWFINRTLKRLRELHQQ